MGPVEVLWDGDGVPPGCEHTENFTPPPSPDAGGGDDGLFDRQSVRPIQLKILFSNTK